MPQKSLSIRFKAKFIIELHPFQTMELDADFYNETWAQREKRPIANAFSQKHALDQTLKKS